MKRFEIPKIEVVTFSNDDVITTSTVYNISPDSNGYLGNNTKFGSNTNDFINGL